MSIINEADLFDLDRITEGQFIMYKKFFSEEFAIAAMPRGFTSGAAETRHILVSEDISNFYVQAFFQRFKGQFADNEIIARQLGGYDSESTIPVSYFFDKIPGEFDFDDYVVFLRKLLDKDLRAGRLTESGIKDALSRESVQQLRNLEWDIDVRNTHQLTYGGMGYVSMSLKSATTTIYYFDAGIKYGLRKNHKNVPEIFQGGNNPFLRTDTISFIGQFGAFNLPFVNVADFFYLDRRLEAGARSQGPVESGYSGIRYSKQGAERAVIPPGKFSM